MKNISQHKGILEIIRRENNSVNGNPRYFLRIDGFKCYTSPDSMTAYAVTNYDGKQVHATIGTYYGKPTLHGIWSV